MKNKLLFIVVGLLLSGCGTSSVSEFYKPRYSQERISEAKDANKYIFLQNGEEPVYLVTSDINSAWGKLEKKRFFYIGRSNWTGEAEDIKSDVIKQSIDIGAVLALVKYKSLGSRTYDTTEVRTSKVYHSDGTSSTIYTDVPVTRTYTRYEYDVVYWAKFK